MIQLGVHLHQFTNINAAYHVHHCYRGDAQFPSFTTPNIIWLIKMKHVELQERKTICYIFANNAEIKTIQCVCACYNMLLPVINGGLKIKKPKRSKDPHRQPDYPNYHMRRIHMSPLIKMLASMVGVRLSSQKLCIRISEFYIYI